MTDAPWFRRPSLHGALAGVLLPILVLGVLAAAGRLPDYLAASRGYALLTWFAPLGFATFLLAWWFAPRYPTRNAGAAFAVGALVASSLLGSVVLWWSAPERPGPNRFVFSLFGGPLVLGFWLWIGALLGHAFRQQRGRQADDAPPPTL